MINKKLAPLSIKNIEYFYLEYIVLIWEYLIIIIYFI